jgi:AcrR family transcriptional regulator
MPMPVTADQAAIACGRSYAHFPDRDAVLMAVVARIFDELTAAIEQGREAAGQDPAGRLVAGCEAYVAFGLEHPARYGVLFSRQLPTAPDYCKPVPIGPDGRPVLEFGAESFALLFQAIEDCVTAGVSASTDVVADATAVWVALHGTVSLRTALPRFPWPDSAASVGQLDHERDHHRLRALVHRRTRPHRTTPAAGRTQCDRRPGEWMRALPESQGGPRTWGQHDLTAECHRRFPG